MTPDTHSHPSSLSPHSHPPAVSISSPSSSAPSSESAFSRSPPPLAPYSLNPPRAKQLEALQASIAMIREHRIIIGACGDVLEL
mmetsp:Transcript_31644/g.101120  ORF Transcript_31644/g.101120 Transcript_31644/m.101120 type:complete len:84 (-) Transcript_31644:64-315(-)